MRLMMAVVAGFMLFSVPSIASLSPRFYEDSSRLATLDTPSGQYNAGVSLMRTVQNYAGAAKWFRLAAKQGHPRARAVLGSFYAVGLGVEKDLVIAYVWVVAALSRLEGPMFDNASALREELIMSMTPEQIIEAEEILNFMKNQKNISPR